VQKFYSGGDNKKFKRLDFGDSERKFYGKAEK